MASREVHIVAILTPAPGKEARVKELLINLTNTVQATEENVLRYNLFEQYNGESATNAFVLDEIYKNQTVLDEHAKLPQYHTLGHAIKEEGLLAAPLDIKFVKEIGGFASR